MVLEYDGLTVRPVGELKHVTDWKEFSSVADEQEGYYFAVVLGPAFSGKPVTVQKEGGEPRTYTDRVWVLRVPDKSTTYTFSADGAVQFIVDFSKITMKEV